MTSQSNSEISYRSLAVIGAITTGVALSGAQFASTSISVFISEIAKDYGWSQAQIGGAVTMLYIGIALSAPVFGILTDRFGPRRVLLPLTVLSGLLIASFSVTGASILLFYAAHMLLGLAQPGLVTYNKMISLWFRQRRAIALSAIGIGALVSQIAVPPLARFLLERFGWHYTYVVFGAVEILIAFPILLALFRERQAPIDEGHDKGEAVSENGRQPRGAALRGIMTAMKSRIYWHLIGSQVFVMFAFLSVTTYGVGILVDRGLDPNLAVWGLSSFAVGGFAAQLVTGYLLDRFDSPKIIAPFALLALLSLLLLQFGRGEAVLLSAIFLFGFGCTACGPTSYFTSRYFGVQSFSSIYGTIFPIMLLLSAGAPVIFGLIFDRTHSYNLALVTADVAMVGAFVLLLLLSPYTHSVQKA